MLTNNYRDILKLELSERCKGNPKYSLRSFARDLGISPSRLSRILNEKEGLSESYALKVAHKLGFNKTETERFVTLVNSHDSRSRDKRFSAQNKLKKIEDPETVILDAEIFRIISEWYHFALLELTDTKKFKSDTKWIAKRLGISTHELGLAIERLKKLELLEEIDGELKQTKVNLKTTSGIPSAAVRSFTKQVLEKAIHALNTQPVTERHFGTLTVSIDLEDIDHIRTRIQAFKDEINTYVERSKKRKKKSEVYNLAIGFFRLTEKE